MFLYWCCIVWLYFELIVLLFFFFFLSNELLIHPKKKFAFFLSFSHGCSCSRRYFWMAHLRMSWWSLVSNLVHPKYDAMKKEKMDIFKNKCYIAVSLWLQDQKIWWHPQECPKSARNIGFMRLRSFSFAKTAFFLDGTKSNALYVIEAFNCHKI